MNKMKQKTKSTIISVVVGVAMLTGGIALGANADKIVEFAADELGYEKVIEEEKPGEETGDETDTGADDENADGDENTDAAE